MKQENELGLRIDVKYNRIYIHRTTLRAIGNPDFVSLGIHPEKKKLVVLVSREKAKNGIHVQDAEDNTFFIQSKVLLDGICMVAPQIGAQSSCLLHGKLLKKQNAVAFDLNNMETITEADERKAHETGLAN